MIFAYLISLAVLGQSPAATDPLADLAAAVALLGDDPGATQDDFDAVLAAWMAANDTDDTAWVYAQLYGTSGLGDPSKPLPPPNAPPPPKVQGWWEWFISNYVPLWVWGD